MANAVAASTVQTAPEKTVHLNTGIDTVFHAAAAAAFALTALGVRTVEAAHAGPATAAGMIAGGAVALSGRFVSARLKEFLANRRADQSHIPELRGHPGLVRLVERAQQSGAFARFADGHWLVRRADSTSFEAMDPAEFHGFEREMHASKTPLTVFDTLPPRPGDTAPSFTMVRTVGGLVDSKLRGVTPQIIALNGQPTAIPQKPMS